MGQRIKVRSGIFLQSKTAAYLSGGSRTKTKKGGYENAIKRVISPALLTRRFLLFRLDKTIASVFSLVNDIDFAACNVTEHIKLMSKQIEL